MCDSVSALPIALPKGVKDFLPEAAGKMGDVEKRLLHTFELWGYRKVITPLFEYLDVLALAEPELLERMFKFEDRASGKMLAMRPDITAQVARLVASHLREHPKPLRLHYSGSVLHYGERDPGVRREIYQAGLELIGLDLPEADGETIAVAIEAIRSTGLNDFKIDVGQVEFFRGVMEGLNLPDDFRLQVESVVARKDISGIEALLPSLKLGDKDERALLALPTLFGDRGVLDKADRITSSSRAKAALENLSEVLDTVDLYGYSDFVTIDMGEIRGLNYYTGVIFEGFVKGVGDAVCGGGRYDSLVGRYGCDVPATGFAIDVESIVKALSGKASREVSSSADYLLFNCKGGRDDALKVAQFMRSKGLKVARDIVKRDFAESKAFAKRDKIGGIVAVGGEGAGPDELIVYDFESDKKKVLKIADLLEERAEISG